LIIELYFIKFKQFNINFVELNQVQNAKVCSIMRLRKEEGKEKKVVGIVGSGEKY
jgi:hypothetical protein